MKERNRPGHVALLVAHLFQAQRVSVINGRFARLVFLFLNELHDSGKKVTATFCLKGPPGASHRRWLSPFSSSLRGGCAGRVRL
jgi:hypothetical protein